MAPGSTGDFGRTATRGIAAPEEPTRPKYPSRPSANTIAAATRTACRDRERTRVRPIPVVFHLGPLAVHTYGVGLALTFWFGYRYFAYRLRRAGFDDSWLAVTFIEIVVAAIVGARIVHVIA